MLTNKEKISGSQGDYSETREKHQPVNNQGVEIFVENLYSSKQKEAIVKGIQKRNSLIRSTKEAALRSIEVNEIRGDFKLDTILSGSTGIGKSYNTKKAFEEAGITPIEIKGNQSMFQFGTLLMLEHYIFIQNKKEEEKLVILIDDCDSFFSNKDNINILKGMTGETGSRMFQYNKAIQEHLLTPRMMEILDNYRNPNGAQGFRVSCDDIVFIMTTNFKLPSENYANNYIKENGPTSRANRLQDLAAIRRRFSCKDFILDRETNWGWIAHVSLKDGLLDFLGNDMQGQFRKYTILDWVWNKWNEMTEHNLDTVKDMALLMLEKPNEYKDVWEADYIDSELAGSR